MILSKVLDISLLCPAVKVLKRLLQPDLNSLLFSPNQHGFCPNHFTVSTLLPLAYKIAQSFNQSCPPLCILTKAIDPTKSYDMVNHTKLISALTLSPLTDNTKRWLSVYLKGRTASDRYYFTVSPPFMPGWVRRGTHFSGRFISLPYSTSLPLHSLNTTSFSPTPPRQMTSLFPVPTPTLIR